VICSLITTASIAFQDSKIKCLGLSRTKRVILGRSNVHLGTAVSGVGFLYYRR
jgi:hypothetical protein